MRTWGVFGCPLQCGIMRESAGNGHCKTACLPHPANPRDRHTLLSQRPSRHRKFGVRADASQRRVAFRIQEAA